MAVLAGCGNDSAPNEENFRAAVNHDLVSNSMKCLPQISWPAHGNPADADDPYSFYNVGMAFVNAGLATKYDEPGAKSNNAQKSVAFSLTDEGRKLLVRQEYQPVPDKEIGQFCYGKVKLQRILNWDAPRKINGAWATAVLYSYELTDVPGWAENARVKATYPFLTSELAGEGHATTSVALVNGRWMPAFP
jgi:hypothetical protein